MLDLSGLPNTGVDTVLFIGAGAVEDSWDPVLNGLGNRIPESNADTANVYFASLVHRLRWLHMMNERQVQSVQARQIYADALTEAKAEWTAVTGDIAKSIKAWHGNKLRGEAEIIKERLLSNRRFEIVTTNWDLSASTLQCNLDGDKFPTVDPIHGNYCVGLLLPGEVVDEPYRRWDNLGEFSQSAQSTVLHVRDCRRMIFWGLSVSPLDAELGVLLRAGIRQRSFPVDEIVVVNPAFDPVIRNLRVHLGIQRYFGIAPSQLLYVAIPEAER